MLFTLLLSTADRLLFAWTTPSVGNANFSTALNSVTSLELDI